MLLTLVTMEQAGILSAFSVVKASSIFVEFSVWLVPSYQVCALWRLMDVVKKQIRVHIKQYPCTLEHIYVLHLHSSAFLCGSGTSFSVATIHSGPLTPNLSESKNCDYSYKWSRNNFWMYPPPIPTPFSIRRIYLHSLVQWWACMS